MTLLAAFGRPFGSGGPPSGVPALSKSGVPCAAHRDRWRGPLASPDRRLGLPEVAILAVVSASAPTATGAPGGGFPTRRLIPWSGLMSR